MEAAIHIPSLYIYRDDAYPYIFQAGGDRPYLCIAREVEAEAIISSMYSQGGGPHPCLPKVDMAIHIYILKINANT